MSDSFKIKDTVKKYILKEFLQDDHPEALTDTFSLIKGGVLDSISTLKLVTYLEEKYKIQFHAYEMDVEHLDTLDIIERTVSSKLKSKK